MQNSTIIPKNIKFELQSEVFNTFRCQAAANSLDIDVKKKSIHKLEVNNISVTQSEDSDYAATVRIDYTVTDDVFNLSDFVIINL